MNMKLDSKWRKGVAATVISGMILSSGAIITTFLWDHFAWADEAKDQIEEVEEELSEVEKLAISNAKAAEALLGRVEAEDAARAQDAKRCRTGVIKDKAICDAAGEKVVNE
jgi:hypothetical protein